MNILTGEARTKLNIALNQSVSEQVELGGILIGHKVHGTIVVTHVVAVPDPHATLSRYTLDSNRAQELLDKMRDRSPVAGWVGYWHTHPEDRPPSQMDMDAFVGPLMVVVTPVNLYMIEREVSE